MKSIEMLGHIFFPLQCNRYFTSTFSKIRVTGFILGTIMYECVRVAWQIEAEGITISEVIHQKGNLCVLSIFSSSSKRLEKMRMLYIFFAIYFPN